MALADLQPDSHDLDVGCGTGGLAIAAAQRVGPRGTVYAIDASPEMVARARHRVARAGVPVTVALAPVEALSYPAGTFDVVLSSLMLLLAVDFEPPRSRVAWAITRLVLTGHMADYDVRTSLPLMRAAGFVEVESGPTPYRWLTAVRGQVRDRDD